MTIRPGFVVCLLLVLLAPYDFAASQEPLGSTTGQSDWPWWRGSHRNGIASSQQDPPTRWSDSENVRWRAKLPGRGHGSAMVFADQVIVAAANHETQTQWLYSFDRDSGELRWKSLVHEGGFEVRGPKKMNTKASLASSTPATDGKFVFINFYNDHAIWTTALDLQGNQIWQRRISDYVIHQGYAASPAVYQDLVIASADNKGGGAIVGLDRKTGETRWRHERPKLPNYSSPSIIHACGRDQLLFIGCELVTSLDPLTGQVIWETEGSTTECVTTVATDGKNIFTSGGYPRDHVSAIVADGTGEIAWENDARVYVPSMVQQNGYLYAVLDAGIAACYRCSDGELMWRSRLGGTFSSSPVIVGETVYATNEDGTTFLYQANPNEFHLLGENQLGTSVFATPTICGSRIYTRVAHYEGDVRQEYLYCLETN